MSRCLLLLAALLFSTMVFSESIYKWVDDKGVTHYSETPPPTGNAAKTIDLAPLPTPATMPAAPAAPTQRQVVIYSTQWCGVCKAAKRYFREHNVRYTEYDVEKSAKGEADYRRLNGHGVPIVLVGNQRMDGFNPERFESMMH